MLLYCSLIFRGKNAKLVKRILEDLMQQQGQQQPRTGFRAYLALLEAETAARVEARARAEILLRLRGAQASIARRRAGRLRSAR